MTVGMDVLDLNVYSRLSYDNGNKTLRSAGSCAGLCLVRILYSTVVAATRLL